MTLSTFDIADISSHAAAKHCDGWEKNADMRLPEFPPAKNADYDKLFLPVV